MEQQPDFPPKPANDSIGRGVGITILCQLACIVLPFSIASFSSGAKINNPRLSVVSLDLFFAWGVAQWIALIPLYVTQKAKGYSLSAKGILITGCVGFLLNAGCAALVWAPLLMGRR